MKTVFKTLIVSSFFVIGFSINAPPVQALLITDGGFSTNWSFGATGTATVSNEGGYLNITTISGPTVWGTAIKSDFSTILPLDNAWFKLQLDVKSGPGDFGEGQGIMLLVEQNSSIYGIQVGKTYYPNNWDTLSFSGSLTEGSFTLLTGSGFATPDFSGGINTFFGFAGGNTISGVLTQYYDNFSLEIEPVDKKSNLGPSICPVPQSVVY